MNIILMALIIKAKYRCTQQELYAIGKLAIDNLEADLADFFAKNGMYVAAYVTMLRNLRQAAIDLPDEEQRNGVHQVLKGLLPALVEPIKDNFNDLKSGIRKAWPTENPTPRYEQAGLVNYTNIGTDNWEHVEGLCEKMDEFVTTNAAALITPGAGMMPAGFAAKVTSDWGAFTPVYDNFMSSRETGTATAAKLTADNAFYDAMMLFMKDGVESVYRKDAAKQDRYTFSVLKNMVSPPGSAGLDVTVINADDTVAINQEVTIKKEGAPALKVNTGANGVAPFDNVDPATYSGLVKGITFVKDVNTGVRARITIKLPAP